MTALVVLTETFPFLSFVHVVPSPDLLLFFAFPRLCAAQQTVVTTMVTATHSSRSSSLETRTSERRQPSSASPSVSSLRSLPFPLLALFSLPLTQRSSSPSLCLRVVTTFAVETGRHIPGLCLIGGRGLRESPSHSSSSPFTLPLLLLPSLSQSSVMLIEAQKQTKTVQIDGKAVRLQIVSLLPLPLSTSPKHPPLSTVDG